MFGNVTTLISCISAAISAIGALYVFYDRYTERKPWAIVSGLSLKVSNPRRKAIHIKETRFSGCAVSAFSREDDTVYHDDIYEDQYNYIYDIDSIILAGETKELGLRVNFSYLQEYSVTLKKDSFFNGNIFNVFINTKGVQQ